MLQLNFYHHIIQVVSDESSVLENLRHEFDFFVDTASATAVHSTIQILKQENPQIPSMVARKILEHGVIYNLGSRKYVDYFGEALIIDDKLDKKITLYSTDTERLYELAFLAIHSELGQMLDTEFLCRIHALAVSIGTINAVVMLPSKGGKSTLLSNLLQNPEVKIISDDMPLCDKAGRIHPFPAKISLQDKPNEGLLSKIEWREFRRHHFPTKWTASLAQLKDRINSSSKDNKTLLIAGFRLSNGQTLLSEVPKWKMIQPMLEHMVIGIGLPQVIELFLNFQFTDLLKMSYHALIRSICALQLVRKSRCYFFYMGPDKTYNSQLLLDLLYENQNP